MNATIQGIGGVWQISQQMGIFCKLLLMKDGIPTKVTCDEWKDLGGEFCHSYIKYNYGVIECPLKMLTAIPTGE